MLWLSLLLLLLNLPLSAEQTQPPSRKRIGIALAGGGVKGLAHVGVIQWMQEHHIPIDAVAGTSMGGLVGGIYATGRDGAEIRKFVDDIDWNLVLDAGSSYNDLTFRRKEDRLTFPTAVELGYRKGQIRLPGGLNGGHQVALLLGRIGFDYSDMQSFDDLPTPFRCVATDLSSGEKVVFADGSLSLALRATMSLPAIFAPVEYQGKLLVDGAIVDNLPADVVRGMNVDVVIAVDLGIETLNPGEPLSLLGVANRSMDIMIRRNALESLKYADIVVKPPVASYSALDFNSAATIIERGYQAAQSVAAELTKYALNQDDWSQYQAARRARIRPVTFSPEFVALTGSIKGGEGAVSKSFSRLSDKPLDREALENTLNRITGLGPYDSANYRQVDQNGKRGLEIDLRRKTHGPPFIRPLLVLDSGQAGAATFTVAARVTAFDFLTRNSEWRSDFSAGRFDSAGTEFYQFIGRRGLFVAPRAFASREQQLVVSNGDLLADYNLSRVGGGIDVGYNFRMLHEFRTGYEIDRLRGQVAIGLPSLPSARGMEQTWMARWRLNALNSGTLPTNGVYVETEVDWNFKSPSLFTPDRIVKPEPYGQALSHVLLARAISPRWSAVLNLAGGGTFRGDAPPFSTFRLGGPMQLSALEVGELRGANFAYASAAILRRIYASPGSAVSRIYSMLAYETGDAFSSQPSFFHSGTTGIMAETKLGILSVGFSYGESGRHGFFFAFGRFLNGGYRNASVLR